MQGVGDLAGDIGRWVCCALFCVILSGCFLTPGRFESELNIRRDGRFSYSYMGEIIFLFPSQEDSVQAPWNSLMAVCNVKETNADRPCLPAEIATQKETYENNGKRDGKAYDDIAALIGFNPLDANANENFAAGLMQYPGWKRVAYVGKGTFQVEYEISGTLDRDFAFPVVPDVQVAMPFVNVARNKGGVVNISAAGLASQQLRSLIDGNTPKIDVDDVYHKALFRADGTFMITTDAEIISTNGKLNQSSGLQRAEWVIKSESENAPRIQLQLDQNP